MKKENDYWKYGEITKLAIEVGMSKTNLSAILHRREGVSKDRAMALEIHSRDLLKKNIPWKAWFFNHTSDHPAFFGSPVPKEYGRKNTLKVFEKTPK